MSSSSEAKEKALTTRRREIIIQADMKTMGKMIFSRFYLPLDNIDADGKMVHRPAHSFPGAVVCHLDLSPALHLLLKRQRCITAAPISPPLDNFSVSSAIGFKKRESRCQP
jgi:hypothetical protein